MPPGITYWTRVVFETTDGPRSMLQPKTKPLAACSNNLDDDDILQLVRQLGSTCRKRGLLETAKGALEEGGSTSGVMRFDDAQLAPEAMVALDKLTRT